MKIKQHTQKIVCLSRLKSSDSYFTRQFFSNLFQCREYFDKTNYLHFIVAVFTSFMMI